ncbi:MAG: fatty acid desaturase [Comamonadaceae bacterium]|nr:fatty acid desaturase [Comamonadaceae bacterium]
MGIAAAQCGLFFGTDSAFAKLAGMMVAVAGDHDLDRHRPQPLSRAHVRSALLNRLYEFVLFYQSGMPSYGWQLNHNFGHHQHFLRQDAAAPFRDEYYWLEPDGTVTPRWRYLLRTVGLAYGYMLRNGRPRPDYLRKLAVVMAIHALVLAALLAYDPRGALICFVAVIVANMFVNAWFSYSHHAGLSLQGSLRRLVLESQPDREPAHLQHRLPHRASRRGKAFTGTSCQCSTRRSQSACRRIATLVVS